MVPDQAEEVVKLWATDIEEAVAELKQRPRMLLALLNPWGRVGGGRALSGSARRSPRAVPGRCAARQDFRSMSLPL